MNFLNRAVFSIIFSTAVLVIFTDSAEFEFKEIKIIDEYGDRTSLLYDGVNLNLICISNSEPELVFKGSTVPAMLETVSANKYKFSLKINNQTKLGKYFCKEKNETKVTSIHPLKLYYKLCSDTSDTCQKSQCVKDFNVCFVEKDGIEKSCTEMQDETGKKGNVHADLFYICLNKIVDNPRSSLFEVFVYAEAVPIYMEEYNGTDNFMWCQSMFEFSDKGSQPLSMGSAILNREDTALKISCTDTKISNCTESRKGGNVLVKLQPECNTEFKLKPKHSSLVTKLTCNGEHVNSSDNLFKTYIFVVEMDTAQYFNDSAPCLPSASERKLLCGLVNPPNDARFSTTSSLTFNEKQPKLQYGHNVLFIVDVFGEYQCEVTLKFKTCSAPRQTEFSKTVSSKFIVKPECVKPKNPPSVSPKPGGSGGDKPNVSSKPGENGGHKPNVGNEGDKESGKNDSDGLNPTSLAIIIAVSVVVSVAFLALAIYFGLRRRNVKQQESRDQLRKGLAEKSIKTASKEQKSSKGQKSYKEQIPSKEQKSSKDQKSSKEQKSGKSVSNKKEPKSSEKSQATTTGTASLSTAKSGMSKKKI